MRQVLRGNRILVGLGLVFSCIALVACRGDDRPASESGRARALNGPIDGLLSSMPDASAPFPGSATEAAEALKTTRNILLVGFDRDEHGVGRTDALLILAVDREREAAGLVSIPRDLWVTIPGAGPGRINSVYRLGEGRKTDGGGRALLAEVIRRELGIRVDHSVEVDFSGFERIVDLLGGVPVRVACPIADRFIDFDHPGQAQILSLDAGLQRLDGRTALLFCRSRHGRGDYDRARRQQAVLLGLRTRALSLDVVPKLPALWQEATDSVRTDLGPGDAIDLATRLVRYRAWQMHGLVLGEPFVEEWRTPQGQEVLLPKREAVAKALDGLFDSPLPGANPSPTCPAKDVAINQPPHHHPQAEAK